MIIKRTPIENGYRLYTESERVFFSNLDNIYSQHNDFLQYVSMGFVVDINCDMGESFGIYRIGNDEEVIKHITSSNIACGFHASDPVIMEKTIKLCKEHNVMAGAHPGYPDLIGFGRRLKKKWGQVLNYQFLPAPADYYRHKRRAQNLVDSSMPRTLVEI